MQPSSQSAFGSLKFSFTGFRFFFSLAEPRGQRRLRPSPSPLICISTCTLNAEHHPIPAYESGPLLTYLILISDLIWHGRAALLELNHPRVGPCKTLFIREQVYIRRCLISGRKCGCKHRWFALKVLPRAHKCEWLCVIDDVLEILPWQTLSRKLQTLPRLYS